MLSKILATQAAGAWVREQRERGHRIGFTCGAFDLLHAGHVDLLERARALCDRLLVAVNSDSSIRAYKNPLRPVNPEAQRMQVVAGLESADAVVLMQDQRPLHLLQRWQPDLYIKGGDYASGGLKSAAAVESYGGQVILLPFTMDQSTTSIMQRIAMIEMHASMLAPLTNSRPIKIVFLDRDGTLIRDVPYLHDPAKVELLPGVPEGLRQLQDAGFRLMIVTNQQGIGLGYFTVEDFFAVNLALFRALASHGVKIDKVYFCPHSFADDCLCRKPRIALIEKALADYRAMPQDCWMLGDKTSDVEAGEGAGCRALLIDSASAHAFIDAVSTILQGPDLETVLPE